MTFRKIYGVLAALLMSFAPASDACRFKMDTRPLSVRIGEQSLAFVGTVTSVAGKTATFEIEHPIKGLATGQTTYDVEVGDSSCHHRFAVGQRWLFAGNVYLSPSYLLSAPDSLKFARVDDARLALPAAWQQCQVDADCAPLFYGCSLPTAVNKARLQQAQEKAWTRFGDPRAVNCAGSVETYVLPAPFCQKKICSMMSITPRR